MKVQNKIIYTLTFVVLLLFYFFPTLNLQAANPIVDIKLSVEEDGTETFDVDDNPGNDSSANNGIVRNLDIVRYKVQINIKESDADNVIVVVTLSDELRWLEIPSSCEIDNVSPTSSISEDKKTLTCNVGNQPEGTAIVIFPIAQVKGSTPHNTTVSAQATAMTDNSNQVTSDIVKTVTTAVPKVDLRKVYIGYNRYAKTSFQANGPSGEEGKIIPYGVALVAERGSEQLDDSIPITFTDIFDNGSGNTQETGRLYTWGPDGGDGACKKYDVGISSAVNTVSLPYGKIGIASSSSEENSVIDSGNISCVQGDDVDDTTFDPVSITITDADLSGDSNPTELSNGNPISIGDNYLATYIVNIWVPKDDLYQPENLDGSGYQMTSSNTIFNFDPISITGQSNYGTNTDDLSNNNVEVLIDDNVMNTGGSERSTIETLPFSYNPYGYSYILSGESFKLKTYHDYRGSGYEGVQQISCVKPDLDKAEFLDTTPNFLSVEYLKDYWDAVIYAYAATYPDSYSEEILYGPDLIYNTEDDKYDWETIHPAGKPNPASTNGNQENAHWPVNEIEYSFKPFDVGEDEITATCNDSDGPWYTMDNIPQGLSVGEANRARTTYLGPTPDLSWDFPYDGQVDTYIDVKAKNGLSAGDKVAFFLSSSWDGGVVWEHASGTTTDDTEPSYGMDVTWPHQNAHYINITSAQVRVQRTSDVTQITAGDTATFTIDSTLESGLSTTTSVTITDTLPEGLGFIENSVEYSELQGNQTISGPVVTTGASGETILVWTIENIETGESLPQISYQVNSDITLTNAEFVTTTVIESPIDTDSSEGVRTSARTVYLKENGAFNVMKLAVDPDNPVVEVGESIQFRLTYANSSDAIDLTGEQFIEVFPFNGDSRTPNTNYNGTLEFDSITGSYGETFEYTNHNIDEVSLNPCHESNVDLGLTSTSVCSTVIDNSKNEVSGTGEVNWYDCSGGFDDLINCPILQNEVTGIRITAPGLPIGTPRQILNLTLIPINNLEDDIYTNDFGGRATEIDLSVQSNDVIITVVMSSIGDTVWFDLDGDGIQDSGESGIPNVTINLHSAGPDDIDENEDDINLSTTTGVNGNYIFSNLHSNEYTITVDDSTLPSDLIQTYDLDGLGTPHTATGDLGIDEDRINFDFGYQGSASLGNLVWRDENYNGIQDSEDLGIPNITVTAVWAGLDGDINTEDDNAIFTTTTDANGNYLFDNIPAGNYIVTVTKPDDSSFTFKNQGTDDELDSDADLSTGQSDQITLAAGEHRRDIDFGIRENPFCGDGLLEENEQCDDGNNIDGDDCSSICTIEPESEPESEPEVELEPEAELKDNDKEEQYKKPKDITIEVIYETIITKGGMRTIKPDHILVNWNDRAEDETSYVIDRKVNDGEFEKLDNLDKNIESYRDRNIEAGNTYTYQVYTKYKGKKGEKSKKVSAYIGETQQTTITTIEGDEDIDNKEGGEKDELFLTTKSIDELKLNTDETDKISNDVLNLDEDLINDSVKKDRKLIYIIGGLFLLLILIGVLWKF